MDIVFTLSAYTRWHYGEALANTLRFWMRALWFVAHFFSIPFLLKTLFSPWKRLSEEYAGGLNLESLLSMIIVNTIMRIVGAFARLFVIAIGLLTLVVALVAGALFFLVWFFAPVVMLVLIFNALAFLF